jgi:hypothetical protein
MTRLSADEIVCVKKMAELYEAGEGWVKVTGHDPQGNPVDEIGMAVPAEKRTAILGVMEHTLGLILNVRHNSEVQYSIFQISPTVLQVAREIQAEETKEEEPEDIVDQVQRAARRRPVLAWIIVAFFIITALITLTNQLLQLLKTLGVLK